MKCLNKIIEYGLYLLVFLLPIQTRWIIKAGETEYGTYSLYGTDILLLILLLLFLFVIASDRPPAGGGAKQSLVKITYAPFNRRLLRRPSADWRNGASRNDRMVWWFIGGLLLMSVVSVFFAVNQLLALYKLGWLILAVGLFWLVVSANYDRMKLIYALLAGIFFQTVLGGWQFLTQSSFSSKWLGLALHRASDLGVSVIETAGADGSGERWLRAYGGTDHPNILGGMLVVAILLLIGIMNYELGIRDKMKNIKFYNTKLITSYFLLLTFSAALFFSFSRGAWLALLVGLALALAEAALKKNLLAQKNILQAVLISGLAFFILFFQFSNLVITRVSGNERLELKSVNERLASIKNSWPIIKNNWAVGVGLGNYRLALKRQEPGKEGFYYQPAHNVFLLVWSEVGIIGLLFLAGLIIFLLVRLLRRPSASRRNGSFRDDSGAEILVALVVLMTFDHWLWSLHFGVLFFWLVLALMTSEKEKF